VRGLVGGPAFFDLIRKRAGDAEGDFRDFAALRGLREALVSPLVPGDARPIPVLPEATGLVRGDQTVIRAGEDGRTLPRCEGFKRGGTGRSSYVASFGPSAYS